MTMHGPRSRSGPLRTLGRLAVVLLLATAAAVGLAGPAAAHNVLISSDPTDGSTLQSAPTTVKLTFDQPVQNFEPILAVLGPDGQPVAALSISGRSGTLDLRRVGPAVKTAALALSRDLQLRGPARASFLGGIAISPIGNAQLLSG